VSSRLVSADVRALAQTYTEEALFKLVTLMRGGRGKDKVSHQTQAFCASIILDRGHGKPPQGHTGGGGQRPVEVHITEHIYPVEERKALGS
jgi:hypothetical protein